LKHSNFMVHVVDSDQAIADGLATLLGAYGIEVRSYPDAGSFLKSWLPRRWRNCCLIADADLPGLGAPALLRELRELKVDIPVLMLVGTSTPEMIEAASRAGAIGVVQKPCLDHTLIDRVLEFRGETAAVRSNGRG
jgi:two-component system CheB/CheR fusion protein